jgi:hypothetical protein
MLSLFKCLLISSKYFKNLENKYPKTDNIISEYIFGTVLSLSGQTCLLSVPNTNHFKKFKISVLSTEVDSSVKLMWQWQNNVDSSGKSDRSAVKVCYVVAMKSRFTDSTLMHRAEMSLSSVLENASCSTKHRT